MALPESCRIEGNELVFYELADEPTLANGDGLYEYTCFVACTNRLRPDGVPEVRRFEYPELGAEEATTWGGRYLDGSMLEQYRDAGYVLCQLRLPVLPMGGSDAGEVGPPPADHPPVTS